MESLFNFNLMNNGSGSGLQNSSSGIGATSDPFDGQGNDFLNPNDIGSEVNGVNLGGGSSVFGAHPDSKDILQVTRGQINAALTGFNSVDANISIFQGGNFALPVPDLGINPSPFNITASTSFFANQIRPSVNTGTGSLFSSNPTAQGILFDVTSHTNALIGRQSIFNRPIAVQKVDTGSGVQTFVPFNPDNPINNTQPIIGIPSLTHNPYDFYHGNAFNFFPGIFPANVLPVPNQFFYNTKYPFSQFPPYSTFPNNLPFPQTYPNPGFGQYFPGYSQLPIAGSIGVGQFNDRYELVQRLIDDNGSIVPDFVPRNVPGGVVDFLFRFPFLTNEHQDALSETYANPTTVDEDILNEAGITSEGGEYEQGVVTNPFAFDGFLTDTNPFEVYNTGLVVSNGNGNGKVKGTEAQDWIFGNQDRSNIIDGQGGVDVVQGGSQADLINVERGDNVSSLGGNDIFFFDFDSLTNSPFTVHSRIDGGGGTDTVVITIDGDPTDEANLPSFHQLADGSLRVTLNGHHLFATNIERFIIADQDGNIGSIFES